MYLHYTNSLSRFLKIFYTPENLLEYTKVNKNFRKEKSLNYDSIWFQSIQFNEFQSSNNFFREFWSPLPLFHILFHTLYLLLLILILFFLYLFTKKILKDTRIYTKIYTKKFKRYQNFVFHNFLYLYLLHNDSIVKSISLHTPYVYHWCKFIIYSQSLPFVEFPKTKSQKFLFSQAKNGPKRIFCERFFNLPFGIIFDVANWWWSNRVHHQVKRWTNVRCATAIVKLIGKFAKWKGKFGFQIGWRSSQTQKRSSRSIRPDWWLWQRLYGQLTLKNHLIL